MSAAEDYLYDAVTGEWGPASAPTRPAAERSDIAIVVRDAVGNILAATEQGLVPKVQDVEVHQFRIEA